MSEPTQLYVGDTWAWTRDLSEYPATDYTLTYYLRNATGAINITAGADGTTYQVEVAPVTTAAYKPGRYDWTARVSNVDGTFTVGTGVVEVFPNFATVGAQDRRSTARKVLDAINDYLIDPNNLTASSYSIGGRSLSRWSRAELLVEREKWKLEVQSEEAADRMAKGLGNPRRMYVRFDRA